MINPYIFAFFGYFAILALLGVLSKQKQTSSSDFYVGDRKSNFWLTALNAHASDMSAWLFMAFPSALYLSGGPAAGIAIGLILGMFLNWQFVAKKLRTETELYGTCTLSTYFEKRFEDKTGILRILTSAISVFFLTAYLAAGQIAMGILFESIFGINYYLSLSVAVSVVILYTFLGGFLTLAWTDFIQGIFLMLMIVWVAIVSYSQIGGWSDIAQAAATRGLSLSLIPGNSIGSYLTLIFYACWGLGYLGQPHIITKFMGIDNAGDIYKSKYLGMAWQIISLGAAALIGLVSLAYFSNGLENPELVFIEMVKSLFKPGFGGIILCAIIAANISTMASQILVCASSLSEDFYKFTFGKHATDRQMLTISRFSSLFVALVSLLFAFNKSHTVMGVVQYAWAGLGCAFGPLLLAALYSKSANRYGAISGVTIGGAIAAFWPFINPCITSCQIMSIVPGFVVVSFTIWGVSTLTKGKVIPDQIETR